MSNKWWRKFGWRGNEPSKLIVRPIAVTTRGAVKMTLQETLNAAKDAEVAAKTVLDEATAAVVAAQAAVNAAMPHMELLARVEAELGNVPEEVAARIGAAVRDIKALLGF